MSKMDQGLRNDATYDPSPLKSAITTTEYPHRTVCLVREVTDTLIEAQFWYAADNDWVKLPVNEIASAKVLRQVNKVTAGEYSLVELGLRDDHPVTEIEALRAQVRFMRDNPLGSCACGTRNTRAAASHEHATVAELTPEAASKCFRNCQYSSGCGWWYCMTYCVLQ
jgi:hypothetical protein